MTEKYAILDQANGHLVNVVLWDGDTAKWQPPTGTSAVRLADIDLATLPPAPAPEADPVTAAEWVDQQGFAGNRSTTMLYLKLQLDAAGGKSSPKLTAVQAWLDGMIVAGVTQPDLKRGDWDASPYAFEEASGEALAVLQS
jgi:hypothetical protein